MLFFSQSRTAVSRTEATETLRRCASRSRSDLSSSDKRQLYISVFMHYIVVHICITLQYNFLAPQIHRTDQPPMETGSRGRYSWLTSADHNLDYLLMSCPQIVLGRYLAVTSFDSGSLVPKEDEIIAGWERDKGRGLPNQFHGGSGSGGGGKTRPTGTYLEHSLRLPERVAGRPALSLLCAGLTCCCQIVLIKRLPNQGLDYGLAANV